MMTCSDMREYFWKVRREVVEVACICDGFEDAKTHAYVVGDLDGDVLGEVVQTQLDAVQLDQVVDFFGSLSFSTQTEHHDEEHFFDVLLRRVLGQSAESLLEHCQDDRVSDHEALLQEVRDHPQQVRADLAVRCED